MQTPLSRVRGRGSARHGTEHFWQMRITSLALLPLTAFFVVIVVMLVGAEHQRAVELLSLPFVALPMLLVVVVSAVHMRLGMQTVIEDYVHAETAKLLLLIANGLFCWIVGLVGGFAILKLAFGGL